MRLFAFGLGYSALATARSLEQLEPGLHVAGTTRSSQSADPLSAMGYAVHLFEGSAPGPHLRADLAEASHVLTSIPPGEAGDPVLVRHGADLLASERLEWLCYYSTVGVYGDFGGAWIDEDAPTEPRSRRSQNRVAAEAAWRRFAEAKGVPLLILRLAGIYGPGRSTFDRLREGTAHRIVKPGQVFNRIHVADIGRITALAARARLAGTFNLADDEPAPPQDLVSFAAGLMGVAPPPEIPFEAAEMSEMARSFYRDNKRVANTRIKAALGIDLLHPHYREGLSSIFAGRG